MKRNVKRGAKEVVPAKAKGKMPKVTDVSAEDSREQTLETGRKFKYPLHVPLQKILINAAIIFGIVLVVFSGFSWWMLYKVQDTGDFFYTATRIVPIPVASVDGKLVRYGDYMRRVRASIFYLEQQENRDLTTEDGRRELEFTRRHNMDETLRVALARQIASENHLSISEEEIDANIQATLDAGTGGSISAKAYESSLRRYFGWSMDDYRHIVRDRLLLRRVSFAIDSAARTKITDIKNQLNVGGDFAELAKQFSDDVATKEGGGVASAVSIKNVDQDGLIAAAKVLSPGQISDVIEGVDAFFVIKLIEKTESTVKYALIKVNLHELNKRFEQLGQDGLITEFIKIQSE